MPDICDLIIEDHEAQRRGFASLEAHDRNDTAGLAALWAPLAELLELHAAGEEASFYPRLVKRGADGSEETLDAIKDHNKIRDAVAAAAKSPTGSAGWWSAVNDAQRENDDHMGEEEREGIPDFRAHTDSQTRDSVGEAFVTFKEEHRGGRLDVSDKDPEGYVAEQS